MEQEPKIDLEKAETSQEDWKTVEQKVAKEIIAKAIKDLQTMENQSLYSKPNNFSSLEESRAQLNILEQVVQDLKRSLE